MKKRVIAVLTAVLMTASLAGCGSGKLSNDYVTVNKYKGLEAVSYTHLDVYKRQHAAWWKPDM